MRMSLCIAVSLLCAFLLAVGCSKTPSPGEEGQKWSLDDMSNYLKGQGIQFEMQKETSDDVPILQLYFNPEKNGWVVIGKCPSKGYGGHEASWGQFWIYAGTDNKDVIKGYQDITKALGVR
ncbi:MAG: hypothetical protein JXA20_06555 [Spirochaetes bacterium]|nr:hypothetical protein [Spirochaetota bacterium]